MAQKVVMKPTSVIEARLGIDPNGPAQKYFTKRAADYMDKYIPYSSGGLAYDTRTIETDTITYGSPYAHYMYEGKVMGPNIPIKEDGIIVGWFSPKGKKKSYTGADINYRQSAGHEYAGPHWDKRMVSAEIDDLVKEVQDFINQGGK